MHDESSNEFHRESRIVIHRQMISFGPLILFVKSVPRSVYQPVILKFKCVNSNPISFFLFFLIKNN